MRTPHVAWCVPEEGTDRNGTLGATPSTRPGLTSTTTTTTTVQKTTKAISDTNLVVSGATAAMLFVGRFAFLPFQRKSIEKAGRPKQNDTDYYEAGDVRSAEAFSVMKTNDPVGFNLVDGTCDRPLVFERNEGSGRGCRNAGNDRNEPTRPLRGAVDAS